ncbi:MAG TPA: phenylacetate--CoA ligase family protein [Ignavibacteria bacterium]|nr:phenylacetate--CoA ligase family protein [Ignavibacteria bacterium]
MSFLELSLKLKGFPIGEAETELKRVQSLSETEFEDWHNKKKWDIVKYHFDNNEFYKKKLGKNIPENWNELPVLSKGDYQYTEERTISDTIKKNDLYSGYTSGSSGHPFKFAKDKYAHAMTWALIKERRNKLGLTIEDRQARFYGMPFEKIDKLIEKAKDLLSNRVRFSVFDMSDEMLESFLQTFKRNKFDYIYGYNNSIVLFARYLLNKGVLLKDVCPTLKLCICTSENCTEEDKNILKKAFGVSAVNEYGTSEVDIIAIDDINGIWKLSEENIFIEILDDDGNRLTGGGEGRILLTSLYNKAMPFIRYEIGDKAVIEPGSGKIILKKLIGGSNDTILLPSGRKSPGITFYFLTRDVLESSGILREFIIKQTAKDKFIFEVVSDREIPESIKKIIQNKIDTYLEPGLSFEIHRVEKIERTKAGKMKHFHSQIK